ncbi:ceramidase [Melampsora americana]|nr:ceramidase [Melampsora americana]
MSSNFHVTKWWSHQPDVVGYWGPATSSIDWCEANYAISRYVAEFTNTFSNLVFVGLAMYGIKKCREQHLPLPLALCQIGIALVGFGSFAFHATLNWNWQLGDELPMIYSACFITYVAFDTAPASSPRSWFVKALPTILSLYAIIVTVVYVQWPNPVFHQVAYAFIQILSTVRVYHTVRNAPDSTPAEQQNRADALKLEVMGSAIFLSGFLIWNIDNIFCDQISQLKEAIGVPFSFLLEGHAWWHLATGSGAYLIVVGLQLLSLTLKEGAEGFELKWGGLCPYVTRVPLSATSKKRIF